MPSKKSVQNQSISAESGTVEQQFQRERAAARARKSRQKKKALGFKTVRLELEPNYYQHFEALCEAKARDLPASFDQRLLKTKAKALVIKEALNQTSTTFLTLTEQIEQLKAEIRALSPSFFKTDADQATPLPQAILALPDDPEHLKTLLARFYKDRVLAKRQAEEWQRRANQYHALYEAANNEVDRLRGGLFEGSDT